jgi:hypothetical protein
MSCHMESFAATQQRYQERGKNYPGWFYLVSNVPYCVIPRVVLQPSQDLHQHLYTGYQNLRKHDALVLDVPQLLSHF